MTEAQPAADDPDPGRDGAATPRGNASALIGEQVRRARQDKGLSLSALSEMADVSLGAISNLERGASSPSIRTLLSVTGALGISLGDLFSSIDDVASSRRAFVVRRFERPKLSFWRTGIAKELLTNLGQVEIELFMLTIEPGGSTGEAYTHRGQEAGFVLEGELRLTVESETVVLQAGDSFGFRSHRPHSFSNPTDSPARVLWINTGNHKEV